MILGSLRRKLQGYVMAVESWWESEGNYIVKDVSFTPDGEMEFWLGLYLDERRSKDERQKVRNTLDHAGYWVVDELEGRGLVEDTAQNRSKVEDKVRDSLPSAKVTRYDSYGYRHKEGLYIQGIRVKVGELNDIDNLGGRYMRAVCVLPIVENVGLEAVNRQLFTKWKEYNIYKVMVNGVKTLVAVDDLGDRYLLGTDEGSKLKRHFRKIGE